MAVPVPIPAQETSKVVILNPINRVQWNTQQFVTMH